MVDISCEMMDLVYFIYNYGLDELCLEVKVCVFVRGHLLQEINSE